MKPLKIVDVVKAVHAIDYTSSNRFDTIDNVQFDSRLCKENSLFVPLVGGQTNGHDYAQKAIDNGAKAILWSQSQDSAPDNVSVIFVDDTLLAMQDLAKYYLSIIHPKVIGITGSNGKTTTKDMCAAILATTYRVHKTNGNYNNDIGVPKTVLDMPEDTQIIVVEMGMDNFNQITYLSQLVQPNISVITLIGDSHLEFLKTREGIAKAKLEILDGMNQDSILIVPENEPLLNQSFHGVTVKTFGTTEQADLQAIHTKVYANKTVFYTNDDLQTPVELSIIGEYNTQNALAAMLVGKACHVPYHKMVEALHHFDLTANRTQWHSGVNGSRLLNDAYNASPTSMKAILKDFQAIKTDAKKYIVLGDMRELGEKSEQLHADLIHSIELSSLNGIFLYGKYMKSLYNIVLSNNVFWFADNQKDKLIEQLKQTLSKDDIVLIKSSFGTNLLEVVQQLKQDD